jgi:hypothetical protein
MAGQEDPQSSTTTARPAIATRSNELQRLREQLADLPRIEELNEELRRVREELAMLRQQQQQTPTPPAPPTPPLGKDLKNWPMPPEFSGKPSEYESFLVSCELYFGVMPQTFTDDAKKIGFVIGRLRGRPGSWGTSLLRSNDACLESWELFKTEMNSMFVNVHEREELSHRLNTLKQTGSAVNFVAEFKTLASILGLNENAKILLFKEKVKDTVKRGLAIASDISTFDSLVARAISIDQTQYLLDKTERTKSARPNSGAKQQNSSSPSSSFSHSQRPRSAPYPSNGPRPTSDPSSGPRGPVSIEEKERRKRLRLCGYCGEDHQIANCPRIAAKEAWDKKNGNSKPNPSSSNGKQIAHAVVLSSVNDDSTYSLPGKHNA